MLLAAGASHPMRSVYPDVAIITKALRHDMRKIPGPNVKGDDRRNL